MPPESRRSAHLQALVTPAEADAVRAAARREGVSLSDWLREAAIRRLDDQ